MKTKGFEVEASRRLPENFELLLSYGYNKLTNSELSFDYLPRQTASAWTTKTWVVTEGATVRLGGGVRYTGKRRSGPVGARFVTGSYTLVDALAEIEWRPWRFAVNPTNLFDRKPFASCLARSDCFVSAPRNVFGTLTYRFGSGSGRSGQSLYQPRHVQQGADKITGRI